MSSVRFQQKSTLVAALRVPAWLLVSVFSFQNSAFPENPKATPEPAKPAKAPESFPLDEEFSELYADYALLVNEIERIDNATGQITIPQSLKSLRARAQAKEKKMQAWIDAHKVPPGSQLDWAGKRFVAPSKISHQEPKRRMQGERQSP